MFEDGRDSEYQYESSISKYLSSIKYDTMTQSIIARYQVIACSMRMLGCGSDYVLTSSSRASYGVSFVSSNVSSS